MENTAAVKVPFGGTTDKKVPNANIVLTISE